MKKVKYKKVRKVQPNLFEYTGHHSTDPVQMQLFVYDADDVQEFQKVTWEKVEQALSHIDTAKVQWLNVHGLHDTALIQKIGEKVGAENTIISDILNVSRRARVEELDEMLFFSIKSVLHDENAADVRVEQISFLLKDNLLLSFQEVRSDFFLHIRERIRTGGGIVRKKTSDYLLYLLLDAVMENFFITLENYETEIEKLMVDVKSDCDYDVLQTVEREREKVNYLKRSILPLRDALYSLKSIKNDDEFNGIKAQNYTFFERLYQKSLELLEQIEYDINTLESVSSIFFSMQNQRMNQIMKTLTIFSVIFMPLTFIVGVYGMNFENMPELKSENGYFIVLAAMFLIVLGMVYYFKNKKWF